MRCSKCGVELLTTDFDFTPQKVYCPKCLNEVHNTYLKGDFISAKVPEGFVYAQSYSSFEVAEIKKRELSSAGIFFKIVEEYKAYTSYLGREEKVLFYLFFVPDALLDSTLKVLNEEKVSRMLFRNSVIQFGAQITLAIIMVLTFIFLWDTELLFPALILLSFLLILLSFSDVFVSYECSNGDCRAVNKRSNIYCNECGGKFTRIVSKSREVVRMKQECWFEPEQYNPWE